MPEIYKILIGGLAGGGIAAIAIGWEHRVRTFDLHPTIAYAIGSVTCLIPMSFIIILLTGDWNMGLIPWLTYALPGATNAFEYYQDKKQAKKSLKEADQILKESFHTNAYNNKKDS